MLKVKVGLRGISARLRPDPSHPSRHATAFHRRSLLLARDLRSGLERALPRATTDTLPVEPDRLPPQAHRIGGAPRLTKQAAHRPTIADRLGAAAHPHRSASPARPDGIRGRAGAALASLAVRERAVPITVAGLVLVASVLSVAPAVGTPSSFVASDESPRLVVGGGVLNPPEGVDGAAEGDAIDGSAEGLVDDTSRSLRAQEAGLEEDAAVPAGPYLADGTLLKPVAVDTSVPDAADKLVTYRVKAGDTLTGIANKFGISMMTVWWANKLTAKDSLKVGQRLIIPPVSGLIVTVAAGETLNSIAKRTDSDAATIASFNELPDQTVIVGQTLIVPEARGAAIATPTPKPAASHSSGSSSTSSHSSGGGSSNGPSRYTGGKLSWPVAGGYISQYYHYGHWAIDIAADYGTKVKAAAGGTVIFAGWKNNGGGYQVHVSHGSGLYTAYYHMSAISVHKGQSIGRGSQVGRIGMTGWATGPHLHFEVWVGGIWGSGHRVNPLKYL